MSIFSLVIQIISVVLALFSFIYSLYKASTDKSQKNLRVIFVTAIPMILIMLAFEFEPLGIKAYLSRLSGGHGGDWLQFWGSYLGIIFSVILTMYVTNKQGEIDRNNARTMHSIELYIDNLMKSLDIFGDISQFIYRCKKYTEAPKQSSDTFKLDLEMILILNFFNKDEISDKVDQLENIIKKMPLKTKDVLKEKIGQLQFAAVCLRNNDYPTRYENEKQFSSEEIKHLEDVLEQNRVFVKAFAENSNLIKEFIEGELDIYNQVE